MASLAEGWKAFQARPWLCVDLLQFTYFGSVAYAAFYVIGPVVAAHRLGGVSAWAAILTASGVGSIVGSTAALHIRPTRQLAVAQFLFLGFVPQLIGLAFLSDPALIAAAALVASATVTAANILRSSALQRLVPEEKLSRLASYAWLPYGISPFGYAVIGLLARDATSSSLVLLGAAIGLTVSSVAAGMSPPIARIRASSGETTPREQFRSGQ